MQELRAARAAMAMPSAKCDARDVEYGAPGLQGKAAERSRPTARCWGKHLDAFRRRRRCALLDFA